MDKTLSGVPHTIAYLDDILVAGVDQADQHTGRIQRVVIEDSVSIDQELDFGVPQGFVLGPRMYTKPVVISFSGMDCLTIPMQMTRSCI